MDLPWIVGDRVEYNHPHPPWRRFNGTKGTIIDIKETHDPDGLFTRYLVEWDIVITELAVHNDDGYRASVLKFTSARYSPDQNGDTDDDI